jgi:RND family efflux transporter MFP subunit
MALKQRWILVLLVVAVVVGVATLEFSGHKAQASPEDSSTLPVAAVELATRAPIHNSLTLSGEFHPYQEVDVHAKVAGYIRHIYVDVGDKVKGGQTLAVLEVPELSAEVTAAKATMRRSEEGIERAEKDLQRAESAHTAAHAAYARLKQASQARPGLIAEQELDDSLAHDQEAEAQVGSAKAALAEAKSQRSVSEADQEHYSALEAYSRIPAPFSGVVTKRYADTGALIQAGTASDTQSMPVVRLAQWSRLRLIVPVPESAVPDLRLGGTVDVRVPSLKRSFKGKIARFADALSDETRTMHTEIDVENADGTLVGGMYAEAEIELKTPQSTLTVPIQAVKRNGDDAEVVVVRPDGTIEPRPVKLGAEGNDRIEVVSGLSEGERLVVGNLGQYQAGEKVQPKLISGTAPSGEGRF